jgi:MATE family multidrug resistance protein
MGRNRRKKKVRAGAAGGSGEGEEETRRLEEPLLPNATPRSPVSIPKPRVAPPPALDLVAASFDEAPSAETLVEPLLRREAPSPRLPNATPRSPVSIPKPRVAASFDEAPSAETLAEPLLRREAPSPRPGARRSRDGDVRLSVTFQELSPVQDEEGEDSDARPSGGVSDDEVAADASASPSSSAPFSPRKELAEIWRLGWPMGVSYFCRMGMASTDSVMVGHYAGGDRSPGEYLAASALSDMVTTLMVVPPLAFNQVLNALCGQAVGSGRKEMAGVWLQQSVAWLGITMAPCLCGFFFVEHILHALGFEKHVCVLAGTYAKYNVFWPVPNGWYQCMRFYFQAIGHPRPAMVNGVIFLFINAALNWVFVFGGPFRWFAATNHWKGLGFVGAAVSLSCSRCLQPLTYFLYMFVYKKAHLAHWPRGGWALKHHTRKRTAEFLKQALPLVGTLLFGAATGQATTLLVSRLGVDAVAATAAVSTATVMWSGAINAMFSMVIAVRVGFHLGRGDGDAARRSFWLATAVAFAVLSAFVAELTTSDAVVARNGARVLPAALLATLFGVLNSLCTGGVFSGQGRQSLTFCLSFFVDIPLSVGGVAAVVLLVKRASLLDVYEFQTFAAALELLIAYAFVLRGDWGRFAEEARARQRAR